MTEKRPKGKLYRIAGLAILVLVFVLFGIYSYVTSGRFFTRIILPRANEAINGTISVESVSFRPFTGLHVSGITMSEVGGDGENALFTATSVDVRYRLFSFLSGNGIVESVEVVAPTLTIRVDANGRSNMDFLFDKHKKKGISSPGTTTPEELGRPSFPFITVTSARIVGGNFSYVEVDSGDIPVRDYRLNGIESTLRDFSPGKDSLLTLVLQGQAQDTERHIVISHLGLSLNASIRVDKEIRSGHIRSDLTIDQVKGVLGENSVDAFTLLTKIALMVDKNGLTLEPLSLDVSQGGMVGGSISARGHYNPDSGEGEFTVNLDGVNRVLLNVIGTMVGDIDFRETSLSNAVTISITDNGQHIRSAGNLELKTFGVLAREFSPKPTEPLDFSFVYESNIDQESGILDVPIFNVHARQGNRDIIIGQLDRPLQLIYKSGNASLGQGKLPDIAYNFKVMELNLTPFQPFLPLRKGTKLTSASLSTDLAILFQQGGRHIGTRGMISVKKLKGEIGGTAVPPGDIAINVQATLIDMDRLQARDTLIRIQPENGQAGSLKLSTDVVIAAGEGAVEVQFDKLDIAPLAPFLASELIAVRRGIINGQTSLRFKDAWGHITSRGNIDISGFSGRLSSFNLANFGLKTTFETTLSGSESIEFSHLRAEMIPGGRSSGTLELSGTADFSKGIAELTVTMAAMTERVANIAINAVAGDVKCQSITMDYHGSLTMGDQFSRIAVEGKLDTRDMLFVDKASGRPLHQKIDITIDHRLKTSGSTLELEKCFLTMTTANTGPENVSLTGQLRAVEGKQASSGVSSVATFALTSDKLTLDTILLAPIEESTSAPSQTGAGPGTDGVIQPAEEQGPGVKSSKKSVDRPPLDMAWLEAVFECTIKRLRYRHLDMKDFVAKASLKNNVIKVQPMSFSQDDGTFEAEADINAGVYGWLYDISTTVNNLQLTPIMESFMPEKSECITGTVNATLILTGTGFNLDALQRDLGGHFQGNLQDGVIRRIPILEELSNVLKIKELEAINFFKTALDADIKDGKLHLKTVQLTGKLQKLGLEGWIGLDQRIDLNLLIALAAPLDKELRKIPYVETILSDHDGYTELPVPIGFKGTLSEPRATLDIGPALEKKGSDVLKGLFEKELNNFFNKQSEKNKPIGDTPQPTPTLTENALEETPE